VGKQSGDKRGVDVLRVGRRRVEGDPERLRELAQLAEDVLPFPDAEVVQVLVAA
jgi:hypothetical protein